MFGISNICYQCGLPNPLPCVLLLISPSKRHIASRVLHILKLTVSTRKCAYGVVTEARSSKRSCFNKVLNLRLKRRRRTLVGRHCFYKRNIQHRYITDACSKFLAEGSCPVDGGGGTQLFQVGVCGPDFRSVGLAN